MRRHTVLSRLVLATGIAFAFAILALAVAFATWPWRARHTLGYNLRINLPPGYSGCPDLRFEVAGSPPTRAEGPTYIIDLPPDGRWYTSTSLCWGESVRFEYFRPTQNGFVKVEPRVASGGSVQFPGRSFVPVPHCID
jgi:hypothetical protein